MADVTISQLGDLTPTTGLFLPVSDASTTGKVTLSQVCGVMTANQITTALGYTPYNGTTNPNGYLNSAPVGGIIKVVSSTLTSVYGPGTGGLSFQDIGLNATINPVSNNSKIMIMFSGNGGSNSGSLFSRLVRGSTAICVGDAASDKIQASTPSSFYADGNHARAHVMNYVDSPNTTSAVTYKVQFASNAGNWYINRSPNDFEGRYASTLTLMEIKG